MGSWCHSNGEFVLREKGTRPVDLAEAIAPRQKFAKTWTFESLTDNNESHMLERLLVYSPGLVFVSAGRSETRVRISSESSEALDAFAVTALGNSGLKLVNTQRLDSHFVLIEVFAAVEHTLQHVECKGPAQIVVDDSVLFHPEIKLTSSGDVFVVSPDEMRTDSITVSTSGAGHASILARKLTIHGRLSVRSSGIGQVGVFSEKLTASSVRAKSSGHGSIDLVLDEAHVTKDVQAHASGVGNITTVGDCLKANSLTVSVSGAGSTWVAARGGLHVKNLYATESGTGEICAASFDGTCTTAHTKNSGSGVIDLREVVATKAVVDHTGSGDTLLHVNERVDVSGQGTGDVVVVGGNPRRVSGNINLRQPGPSRVESLLGKKQIVPPIPTRADAFAHAVQSHVISVGIWAALGRYLRASSKQGHVNYAPHDPHPAAPRTPTAHPPASASQHHHRS